MTAHTHTHHLRTAATAFAAAILLCLLPMTAAAQAEPTARQVLDRTADTYRNGGGTRIAFTVSSGGEDASGTICLKGDKFVLDMQGIRTWYDGHTQWTYLEQNGEVNISEPTAEQLQTLNPYGWLDMYKSGYDLSFDDNTSVHNIYKVVMTTTDRRRQDLQSIVVMIDRTTYCPRLISMAGRGGKDVAVINITQYAAGLDFDDKMFTFDRSQYPDAEIVDLR